MSRMMRSCLAQQSIASGQELHESLRVMLGATCMLVDIVLHAVGLLALGMQSKGNDVLNQDCRRCNLASHGELSCSLMVNSP